MKVAIIGAGSWGTALSQVASDAGSNVVLYARREEVAKSINERHSNCRYLADSILPEGIRCTTSMEEALEGSDACLVVTPSMHLRSTANMMAACIDPSIPIGICSKGVEEGTGLLATEVVADAIDGADSLAVISGPTHAEEVINRVPTGAVIASKDLDCAQTLQSALAARYFRSYTSNDVVGVELCASFKNVLAIAVGISYGLGLGDNTSAILMTRGLAEMARMVVACGGNEITCLGLAGTGDMVVTCMSRHSRNRRFGQDYIAKGLGIEDFIEDTHMVVEGAQACKTLQVLSERHGVELPITDAVRKVIWEGASPDSIAKELFHRPLKDEFASANGIC